jgi:2-desacetyl-2-hydroxyethyl bacteriochlorophyllide A dehydrogenase
MKSTYAVINDKFSCEIREENIDINNIKLNELIIQTNYSVISAGTELAGFSALSPGVYQKGSWNAYPWRPGYGLSGKILHCGSSVDKFKPNDRVFCFGNHSSVQVYALDLSEKNPVGSAFKCREELNMKDIAAARMALVSISAPQISGVRLGDTVVVIGLGMVGNLAAQLYKIMGAKVIAFDMVDMRCDLARKVGIQYVEKLSGQQQIDYIMEKTNGEGADITIDAVGNSSIINTCIKVTKTQGKIVLLGSPRTPKDGNVSDYFYSIHKKGLNVLGSFEWRLPPYNRRGINQSIESNLAIIWNYIEEDKLKIRDLITHVIKPNDLQSAYQGLLNNKEEYLGVLIDWGE